MKKPFVCFFMILIVSTSNVFGWGGKTHRLLTHYSWLQSRKLGDAAFLAKLNFDKGMLNERLTDGNEENNLDEWLQYGAEHEDDTSDPLGLIPDRSNFHFHNPLKEWGDAGLSDVHFGASGSSIYWAQNSLLQAIISNDETRTWHVAREYFHNGLTEISNMNKRNIYFAELFKTLGNQIHLI